MKKFILFSIILSALSSTVISCGSPPKKETDSSSTTPEKIKDVNFDNTPKNTTLYVGIQSRWEGRTELTSHGACQVTTMSQPEVVTDCEIKVPEGQLFYSDLIFTVGSKTPEVCTMVVFSPYYYRKYNDDTSYTPPGAEEPMKCGSNARNLPECWGGAGPLIYPDFPLTGGQYFLLSGQNSASIVAPSANKNKGLNNKATSNNLVDRATPRAGYIGNSMVDYYVQCRDIWAHPIYTFKLKLLEEDTKDNDGVYDEITDWE